MPHWPSRLARQLVGLLVTAAAGAALTAAMVRTGPGYGSDERLLDPRLNAASRAAIRLERLDLGYSESFRRPVTELLRERWRATAGLMLAGLAGGWAAAMAIALLAAASRRRWIAAAADFTSSLGLSMPTAVIAVLVFLFGGPARAVIALVLFPRLYETLRNLLSDAYASPQVLNARANGLRPLTVLLRFVLPAHAAELLALAGISIVTAFGACIPVETLCDVPGIGQLAWKAAIARDLPLLVALTVVIALLTQLANAAAEWVTPGQQEARA